mmetsp:Transcript_41034/g.66068  ORF Transcript_41034/g.66068 Transcript_41034/m.66068 type:complete len:144 (-) Transcript_41034:3449-3880(-)
MHYKSQIQPSTSGDATRRICSGAAEGRLLRGKVRGHRRACPAASQWHRQCVVSPSGRCHWRGANRGGRQHARYGVVGNERDCDANARYTFLSSQLPPEECVLMTFVPFDPCFPLMPFDFACAAYVACVEAMTCTSSSAKTRPT